MSVYHSCDLDCCSRFCRTEEAGRLDQSQSCQTGREDGFPECSPGPRIFIPWLRVRLNMRRVRGRRATSPSDHQKVRASFPQLFERLGSPPELETVETKLTGTRRLREPSSLLRATAPHSWGTAASSGRVCWCFRRREAKQTWQIPQAPSTGHKKQKHETKVPPPL